MGTVRKYFIDILYDWNPLNCDEDDDDQKNYYINISGRETQMDGWETITTTQRADDWQKMNTEKNMTEVGKTEVWKKKKKLLGIQMMMTMGDDG